MGRSFQNQGGYPTRILQAMYARRRRHRQFLAHRPAQAFLPIGCSTIKICTLHFFFIMHIMQYNASQFVSSISSMNFYNERQPYRSLFQPPQFPSESGLLLTPRTCMPGIVPCVRAVGRSSLVGNVIGRVSGSSNLTFRDVDRSRAEEWLG